MEEQNPQPQTRDKPMAWPTVTVRVLELSDQGL